MLNKIVILREIPGNNDPLAAPNLASSSSRGNRGTVLVDIEVNPSQKILHALNRDPTVLNVAPSISMKLIEPLEEADSFLPEETAATWGVTAVGAQCSPFDGAGITVAVLDTGIDATHSAFSGMSIDERDFTGAGNGDQHGHGTHCSGTIFGRAINGCRIGVAPGVTRALIGKVLGGPLGGASDTLVEAILWARERGANIISMSLGIDFPGFVERLVQENGLRIQQATSIALQAYGANIRLFERLTSFILAGGEKPVLIVAAAGNESGRDQNPTFEINVAPPAASPGIVSVGALAPGSEGFLVAPFSNTRATIVGPGVGILSARSGGGLRRLSGTSMATPHVAGIAALWAEKLKRQRLLTSDLLQARVIASGTLTGLTPGCDPLAIGSGLVQAPSTLN